MKITNRSLANFGDAQVSYATCALTSKPYLEFLIISFQGTAGNSQEHWGTFRLMKAMIAAGLAAWETDGLVLDMRELAYEWGDEMLEAICIQQSTPVAIIVSDLNREGMTSLIVEEMGGQSEDWLFNSLEEAISALDRNRIS